MSERRLQEHKKATLTSRQKLGETTRNLKEDHKKATLNDEVPMKNLRLVALGDEVPK